MKIDNRLSFEKVGKELKYIPGWLQEKRKKQILVVRALKYQGAKLSERDKRVVKLYYGIGGPEHSHTEIGKILKLTRQRAGQIVRLAIFRLGLDGNKQRGPRA